MQAYPKAMMDDSMADWLAYARALLLARAPRDWEIVTSAPTLLINDKALHIHVKNPATPAATLSLPKCPSQIMSVMLYAI